jgi:hypothetical protein
MKTYLSSWLHLEHTCLNSYRANNISNRSCGKKSGTHFSPVNITGFELTETTFSERPRIICVLKFCTLNGIVFVMSLWNNEIHARRMNVNRYRGQSGSRTGVYPFIIITPKVHTSYFSHLRPTAHKLSRLQRIEIRQLSYKPIRISSVVLYPYHCTLSVTEHVSWDTLCRIPLVTLFRAGCTWPLLTSIFQKYPVMLRRKATKRGGGTASSSALEERWGTTVRYQWRSTKLSGLFLASLMQDHRLQRPRTLSAMPVNLSHVGPLEMAGSIRPCAVLSGSPGKPRARWDLQCSPLCPYTRFASCRQTFQFPSTVVLPQDPVCTCWLLHVLLSRLHCSSSCFLQTHFNLGSSGRAPSWSHRLPSVRCLLSFSFVLLLHFSCPTPLATVHCGWREQVLPKRRWDCLSCGSLSPEAPIWSNNSAVDPNSILFKFIPNSNYV